jgi:putative phosphoesterase
MKIGVVSDTHSRPLPPNLIKDFQKVDLIIHAGDFCLPKDYDIFRKIKDTKAVWGNMDGPELRKLLPEVQMIQCENVTIGLYHGAGSRQRILETVREKFKNQKVDVVIFGHSHQWMNERIDGVLYFNPGSPNDDITAKECTYGILDVEDKHVSGKIIKVK